MVLIVTTLIPDAPGDVAGTHALPCDLLEIRLEQLAPEAVESAVDAAGHPVVASCRRATDGASIDLDDEARAERLRAAMDAGAAFVDIEHDAPFRAELTQRALTQATRVIVSHHDLDATPSPDEGIALLETMRDRADIVKLATQTRSPGDVEDLFHIARRAPSLGTPFTVMGIGDAAVRATAGPLGMALVYTAPGRARIPGQLPVHLQRHLPRQPPPPEGFQDFVLLGHPVGHSLSPRMQNAAFSWLGEGARYRLIDVPPGDLKLAFEGLRLMNVAGGNVTAPHKGAVFELCDRVQPAAETCRAVNAFHFRGDEIVGHNTDGLGALHALQARAETLSERPTLLIGAGGTARACAHAFTDAGAELTIANRTPGKAEALASELGAEIVALEQDTLDAVLAEGAVLFNATPVDPPISQEALARAVVFDATYGPGRAELARRAELAGTRALDGLDLLVHQGDLALRFWLDLAADDELLGVMSCAARTGELELRFAREAP